MKYKIIAHTSYGGRLSSYEEGTFNTKKEANDYFKARCYTTPSRTYTIEKV